MRRRVETLIKKAEELVTQYQAEILIIVRLDSLKHIIDFCNTDANKLFFSVQEAKANLERQKVDIYKPILKRVPVEVDLSHDLQAEDFIRKRLKLTSEGESSHPTNLVRNDNSFFEKPPVL